MYKFYKIIILILSIITLIQAFGLINNGDNTYIRLTNKSQEKLDAIYEGETTWYNEDMYIDNFAECIIDMIKNKDNRVYELISNDSLNMIINENKNFGLNKDNLEISDFLSRVDKYDYLNNRYATYQIMFGLKKDLKNIEIGMQNILVKKYGDDFLRFSFEFLSSKNTGGTD